MCRTYSTNDINEVRQQSSDLRVGLDVLQSHLEPTEKTLSVGSNTKRKGSPPTDLHEVGVLSQDGSGDLLVVLEQVIR